MAPLDMVEYNKEKVKLFLQERFGWQPYENKHYENVFTRFYEGYYLPHKFGYDKRKCYFSNEILAGTMTREEALAELEQPPYDPQQMEEDRHTSPRSWGSRWRNSKPSSTERTRPSGITATAGG